MITVVVGNIEKVGTDYIWWGNGADKRQINFDGDRETTKEDMAGSFREHVGKPAALPVDGPPFIAVDSLPGDFEGTAKWIPLAIPIASVEKR